MSKLTNKKDILSLSFDELEKEITQSGEKSFRSQQIFMWLHKEKVTSFDEMTNLSKELRNWLRDNYYITTLKPAQKQVSQIDGTIKYLFGLADDNAIETVQMEYSYGSSLCISTQVGCRMGCRFCASTIGGLVRSLTAGEMLAQVYTAEKLSGKTIGNVVLMGIGEPLDNFESVIKFINTLGHPKGKNLSLRSITLSSCGIVPEIRKLADLNLPITLAVSLHGADDKTRSQIMPVNKKWNLESLLEACRYYFSKTGRRITFEYALISGVNDNIKEAEKLAALLKDLPCHINLIPINKVKELGFDKSQNQAINAFKHTLEKKGFAVTTRRELGSDISAACGQLRHESS